MNFKDFECFYKYVTGKQSHLEIEKNLGKTRQTVSHVFSQFFAKPVTAETMWQLYPPSLKKQWVYGVDGTYLKRFGVIIIHKSVLDNSLLWWSWAKSESYESIGKDLSQLVPHLWQRPYGAVSDWKGSLVGSTKAHFGTIPHQRCLAHIDRDLKRLLPQYSPLESTQKLRAISTKVIQIRTVSDFLEWKLDLGLWEIIYADSLKEKTVRSDLKTKTGRCRWWYTHSNIRSAWRILTKDQESLFLHLKYRLLPTTSNSLEGSNTHIKTKLGNHRGITHQQQVSFVFWLLIFKCVHSKSDLIKLWDYWRTAIYSCVDTRNLT